MQDEQRSTAENHGGQQRAPINTFETFGELVKTDLLPDAKAKER